MPTTSMSEKSLRDSAERHTADAAKTVDTNFDRHLESLLRTYFLRGKHVADETADSLPNRPFAWGDQAATSSIALPTFTASL
jgi:hypothetical protein